MTATLKLCFGRHKREVFYRIKDSARSVQQRAVEQMLEATRKKQISSVKLWLRNAKLKNKMF